MEQNPDQESPFVVPEDDVPDEAEDEEGEHSPPPELTEEDEGA